MSDQQKGSDEGLKGPKERSPSFPFIGLPTALERLAAYDTKFGRHPTPANKVGLAWGMKEASSQAQQTLAALKSFGMVEYQGVGPDRIVSVTEDARNLLRAQQDSVKKAIVRRLALKPKLVEKYWGEWGHPRPIDEVCLDQLVLKGGFTQTAAETFLRVYDATISSAGLAHGVAELDGQPIPTERGETLDDTGAPESVSPPPAPQASFKVAPERPGEEMDRFTVDEGVVTITFPSGMSAASVGDLADFFNLFIKKAKRRASSPGA